MYQNYFMVGKVKNGKSTYLLYSINFSFLPFSYPFVLIPWLFFELSMLINPFFVFIDFYNSDEGQYTLLNKIIMNNLSQKWIITSFNMETKKHMFFVYCELKHMDTLSPQPLLLHLYLCNLQWFLQWFVHKAVWSIHCICNEMYSTWNCLQEILYYYSTLWKFNRQQKLFLCHG